MKVSVSIIDLAVLGLLALLAFGRFDGCTLTPPLPPPVVVKVTAATYTYDDKKHSVPPPVAAAISKLNEMGIEADLDEVDTTDGTGEIPDQFKVSRPAALKEGLPSMVLMGDGKVLKVLKDPRLEEPILEAVK